MKDSVIVKRIWQFAKPYKLAFLISYSVLLVELFFSQMIPLFLEDVINFAVYEADLQKFLYAALWYALIFLGYAACGFIQLILWQRVHNKYVYDVRIACYRKVLRMKPTVLSNIKTGDVIRTINNDTAEFHHIIQRFAMRILNAGIGTVVSLGIVAFMKWEIALLMASIIPISAVICKRIERNMKKVSDEVRTKQGEYSAWLMEILKGMREIKLFVAEQTILKLFMHKNKDIVDSSVKQDIVQFKADQMINGIYFLADIFFYIICAFFVANRSINIGQYIAIASYFSMVSWSVRRVLYGNVDYQRRKTCVERVFNLLDEEEENADELSKLDVQGGSIEIRNLLFFYNEKKEVLKNINLQIKPGQKIGVVGQSGVGKSTLANLLLRFYEPVEGEILIDGQLLNNCTYSSIRQAIGIVNQENIIFDTTVRENITFGKAATDEELWGILEKVYLKAEIEKLPNGLDSVLGKENMSLSGGQNQRLCIARLMFRNPKIIILDEATSSLDFESESVVQSALDVLAKDKTTIVISHRYKALLRTDKILVLHEGEQVGYGPHDVLMAENQYFADMFAGQKEVTA